MKKYKENLIEKLKLEYEDYDNPQSDEFYETLAQDIMKIGESNAGDIATFLVDNFGYECLDRNLDEFIDDILRAGLQFNVEIRKEFRH